MQTCRPCTRPQVYKIVEKFIGPIGYPPSSRTNANLETPFTLKELAQAISKSKSNRALGEDGIAAECYKAMDERNRRCLLATFNRSWRTGRPVPMWKDTVIVPLHKKGDKADPNNYRGISLICHAGKILERLLKGRLEVLLSEDKTIIQHSQYGFARGKSTIDAIFVCNQIVEKAIEQSVVDEMPSFNADDYDEIEPTYRPIQNNIVATRSSSMKSLMSRMISCVINYPTIVNDPESSSVIEERVRNLPKSEVLVELIRYAQVESDLSKDGLLAPFKSKERVYSRLKELSVMEPFLSEYEAKEEFGYTLTAAEKYYERKSTKASILSAKTHDDEKLVMENIMKSKANPASKKLT